MMTTLSAVYCGIFETKIYSKIEDNVLYMAYGKGLCGKECGHPGPHSWEDQQPQWVKVAEMPLTEKDVQHPFGY